MKPIATIPSRTSWSSVETLTIRMAVSADAEALGRLAQLDSAPPPAPVPMLLAEAGGKIRAAVAVSGDGAVADPFAPTAEMLSLLELRAQQMRRDRRTVRGGVLSALHLRPGRIA